jgi:hypothetical protein
MESEAPRPDMFTQGTGRSVVVDDATGEVFHVGGDGFEYHD